MAHQISTRSRFRGSLSGLAIGDAIGTAVEFKAPGTFVPLTGMTGGGPFDLRPGQWTDDTSLGLCLATSLIEMGGFDARDQLNRYVRWYRTGYLSSTGACFDIGNTTRAALHRYERLGEPFAGDSNAETAGNGSLMRLAPVPLAFSSRPGRAIAFAAESSRTTHGAKEAVDACRYMSALIVGAIGGATKETLLAPMYSPVPGLWEREPLARRITDVAAGSFKRKNPPEIRGTGYVVESLEAALWAFHKTDAFARGCLAAANLGDDADTTAAIFGQLAGAYYGHEALPEEWVELLAMKDTIERLADGLYELSISKQTST